MKKNKYQLLLQQIKKLERVAVAYSGGVDSSLLLYAAIDALGPANVQAFTARSVLTSQTAIDNWRFVYNHHFGVLQPLNEIEVDPLSWQEIATNSSERCYHCKKNIYLRFLKHLPQNMQVVLVDGTNADDLHELRPGLRAIKELKIITPLADAGFTKTDVRHFARRMMLSNHNLPANSCLATRVPQGMPLCPEILKKIEQTEQFLVDRGFAGCRVKFLSSNTKIEIPDKYFNSFVSKKNRLAFNVYLKDLGLPPALLNLQGR